MATLGIYLSDEEYEWAKNQPKGLIRDVIRDRILAGTSAPQGKEPLTVYLTPAEVAYVRDREEKNGPGWFGRVVQINMKARDQGLPPFYWLRPEGLEET